MTEAYNLDPISSKISLVLQTNHIDAYVFIIREHLYLSLKVILQPKTSLKEAVIVAILTQAFQKPDFFPYPCNIVKVYSQVPNTFDIDWMYELHINSHPQNETELQLTQKPKTESSQQQTQSLTQSQLTEFQGEANFRKALENCQKSAEKAYQQNLSYADETEKILKKLNQELKQIFPQTRKLQKAEWETELEKVAQEINKLAQSGMDDLRQSLDIKKAKIPDFTLALFGRTKAGKSTIREALTNGSGDTIGKGSQRTTRDVREYKWRGLRLLDTPGIEAYQGEEDTAKANDVIDQSDIVIFLTSDDSVQPGEFQAMQKLKKINKFFIVLLNVKYNIESNPEDIEMLFDFPEMVFDEESLAGHKKHIKTYVKEYLELDTVDILPIHAKSAFLSQQPQYSQYSHQLHHISQIEHLYGLIATDILQNGIKRRTSTFFDGTANYIGEIENTLTENQQVLLKQINFLEKKRKDFLETLRVFTKESNLIIENEIVQFFSKTKRNLIKKLDNQRDLEQVESFLKNTNISLNHLMQDTINLIKINFEEKMQELERQYEYDTIHVSINFGGIQLNEIQKENWGQIVGFGAAAIGLVAIVGGPVAIGVAVIGGLGLGFLSQNIKKQEQQKYERQQKEHKDKILKEINSLENEAIKNCKNFLREKISTPYRQDVESELNSAIEKLNEISEKLQQSIDYLRSLQNRVDKKA